MEIITPPPRASQAPLHLISNLIEFEILPAEANANTMDEDTER